MKLDRKNRKLLHELDKNARLPISRLAKALKLGRDLVDYRVNRLVDTGVIRAFSVQIDPYRLGLTIYKVYLRVENLTTRKKALIRHLEKHPNTYWISICDGRWDCIFSVVAESPQQFYKIYTEILSEFHDIVSDSQVATVVDVSYWSKGYLSGTSKQTFSIGQESTKHKLDTLDTKLLKLLIKEGDGSVAQLSRKLRTTPAKVQYRLERLEEWKVISGFRLRLNLNLLQRTAFKVQLSLRSYQEQDLKKLETYCFKQIDTVSFVQQIGVSQVEIEIHAESYYQFHDVIADLRKNFCGLIQHMDTILVRDSSYHWQFQYDTISGADV